MVLKGSPFWAGLEASTRELPPLRAKEKLHRFSPRENRRDSGVDGLFARLEREFGRCKRVFERRDSGCGLMRWKVRADWNL